jgi:hypothetical protein
MPCESQMAFPMSRFHIQSPTILPPPDAHNLPNQSPRKFGESTPRRVYLETEAGSTRALADGR